MNRIISLICLALVAGSAPAAAARRAERSCSSTRTPGTINGRNRWVIISASRTEPALSAVMPTRPPLVTV